MIRETLFRERLASWVRRRSLGSPYTDTVVCRVPLPVYTTSKDITMLLVSYENGGTWYTDVTYAERPDAVYALQGAVATLEYELRTPTSQTNRDSDHPRLQVTSTCSLSEAGATTIVHSGVLDALCVLRAALQELQKV